jgi:hypothetical protein
MTQQVAESGADSAVAEAFGVGSPPEDANGGEGAEQEEAQVAEDVPLEELPAAWQEEVRRLRRENASQRVARRDAQRSTREQGDGDDKSPSAQAIRAAEERGRQAARLESGVRLAGAEVRAALAATLTEEQIEDLVEDLNLSRFVTDDGDVDREAVKHFRDRTVSILGKKTSPRPGHGQRQGAPTQKSNADLFGDWLNSGGG